MPELYDHEVAIALASPDDPQACFSRGIEADDIAFQEVAVPAEIHVIAIVAGAPGGMLGPVRTLLGGEHSPAAFVWSHARGRPSVHWLARVEWADRCCPFPQGKSIMAITIEATYENGMLKPAEPLPLKEFEKVRVTVHTEKTLAEQTAGLMGWTGPAELADYFAMDPELDFPAPPEEP